MSRIYWKCREKVLHMKFHSKSILFRLHSLDYRLEFENAYWKIVIKNLMVQIAWNSIIVFLLLQLDKMIDFPNVDVISIDYTLLADVLIAAVGIAGVFLGLYCSNMMSVFTSRYMNAPGILIGLFEKDMVVNKCIKSITNFLVLSILVLVLNFIGIHAGIILISYCFFNAISIVIAYGFSGRRSYSMGDTYNITKPLYWDLHKKISFVTNKKMFCKDATFQNHCRKTVQKNIDYLNEIIAYTNEQPTAKEVVMRNFLKSNLSVLNKYWDMKDKIPYDSFWYSEKNVHSKWHKTSDNVIDIAISTGTALMPRQEKDYYWLEENIIKLNKRCLVALLNDNSFENLYAYIEQFSRLSFFAVKSDSLKFYLRNINELKQQVLKSVTSKESVYTNNEKLAIVEILMILYVDVVLSMKEYLEQFSVENTLNTCIECTRPSDVPKTQFFNCDNVRKLYDCINAEIKVEGMRITPDWYVQQIVAKRIYDFLLNLYVVLDNILNSDVPQLAEEFLKNERYAETMLIYSRMTELKSKSEDLIDAIETNISLLEKYHIEKTIIWDENPVKDFRERQNAIMSALPGKWCECSYHFTLGHYDDSDDFPDFLGECYNYVCEFLIRAIEQEDFDSFFAGYRNLWKLAYIYQEVIREDVIKIKEPHLQDRAYKVFSNPIIECCYISGYAYLLGEISNRECWKKAVEDNFNVFVTTLSKNEEETNKFCDWISKMISMQHRLMPAIYNRDIIHTQWDKRFEKKILSSDYLKWKHEMFEDVLDSSNSLLKAVFGTRSNLTFMYAKAYEVFAIKILNSYLEDDKKYRSLSRWEERL